MNPEKFGRFIHEERIARGWTQKQLAEAVGVSDKAVSKWERGICLPDVAKFGDIARALEVSDIEVFHAARNPATVSAAVHYPPSDPISADHPPDHIPPRTVPVISPRTGPILPDADGPETSGTERRAFIVLLRRVFAGWFVIALVCQIDSMLEFSGILRIIGLGRLLEPWFSLIWGIILAVRLRPDVVQTRTKFHFGLCYGLLLALTCAMVFGTIANTAPFDELGHRFLWLIQTDWNRWSSLYGNYPTGDLGWDVEVFFKLFLTESILSNTGICGLLLCLSAALTGVAVRSSGMVLTRSTRSQKTSLFIGK